MTSFFDTPEFKKLEKIRNRIMQVNTPKNLEMYLASLMECKCLCSDKFYNVGYDAKKNTYRWELDVKRDCPPLCIKYYSEKLKRNIYIAMDSSMVLIEKGNKFIRVESKELDHLISAHEKGNKPDNWLDKIIELKSEFEGVIVE